MSRYISNQSLQEESDKVDAWFSQKQQEIDDMVVPDFATLRAQKGYYDEKDDAAANQILNENKSFFKIPEKAGAALKDIASLAKATASTATGGVASGAVTGYLSLDDDSSFFDFSDSDAILDPGGMLRNYITKDEQNTIDIQDNWQTASTIGSVLLSLGSLGTANAFAAISGSSSKNIRESTQEALGMRSPEILARAVTRYNADLTKQAQIAQDKVELQASLDKTKDTYDMADMSSTLYVQKVAPVMESIQRRSLGLAASIPYNIHIPSASNIPIDMSKGRGLKMHMDNSLIPAKEAWHRRLLAGHKKDFYVPSRYVRY